MYPFLDKDLLFAGAILHDIAKISEFTVADTGIATGYSTEGNLLGHLAMGAMVIDQYAQKLGIDKKTAVSGTDLIILDRPFGGFFVSRETLFIFFDILLAKTIVSRETLHLIAGILCHLLTKKQKDFPKIFTKKPCFLEPMML